MLMYRILFSLFFIFSSHLTLLAEETLIRLGYFLPSLSNVDAKDVKLSLDYYAAEIGKQSVEFELETHFYKDLETFKDDIIHKRLDAISASFLILAKEFDTSIFKSGFKPVSENEVAYNRLVLLVRNKSKINTLQALKNKKILRIDNNDVEDLFMKVTLQKKFNKDPSEFFEKNIFVDNYAKAVMQLFFNKADAALVTQAAFDMASELNPQISKNLKIIDHYDLSLRTGFLFLNNFDQEKVEKFKQIAFKMHQNERGKQILNIFKADYIVEGKIADIDTTRKMYQEYMALK